MPDQERAAQIMLIAAELNAYTAASYAQTQGMIAANTEQLARDGSLAYGEQHFTQIRDEIMSESGSASHRVRNL